MKLLLMMLLVMNTARVLSSKILTMSLLGGSHFLVMDEISKILAADGHVVTMILSPDVPPSPGMNYSAKDLPYTLTKWSCPRSKSRFDLNKELEDHIAVSTRGESGMSTLFTCMRILADACDCFLSDDALWASVRAARYDALLADGFNPCSSLAARRLAVPYVSVMPVGPLNWHESGLPSPPSYVPMMMLGHTDTMGLLQRVKNLAAWAVAPLMQHWLEAPFEPLVARHFANESSTPACGRLGRTPDLWFYSADHSLEFPRPLLPNTIMLGAVLSKPARELPADLEKFVSGSGEAGFVLVSLGTVISHVSDSRLIEAMAVAVSRLPQRILWKYQVEKWPARLPVPGNVHLAEWLPQNDLLGHRLCRAFVSHCGHNSMQQAVHHAVPVVAVPLFADQHDNALQLVARGAAIGVSVAGVVRAAGGQRGGGGGGSGEFYAALKAVIDDPSYGRNVHRLSRIQRSLPFDPSALVTAWTRHVLAVGDGQHLRVKACELPTYQYFLLDVLALATTVLLLAVVAIRWIWRLLKRLRLSIASGAVKKTN